ncbi:MAG: class I SAM-dependent methyltransferase [Parvularculaceae bacterium]
MQPEFAREMISYIANVRAAGPLQTRSEQSAATRLVELLGFEGHHDHQKNWDTLKCLAYVLGEGDRNGPILDAGSGAKAVVLRWLHALGYRRLYACDLMPANTRLLDPLGIEFTQQDLTATTYADNFFKAVTSISVIEHNVPLDKFVAEMHRILQPRGLLLVSTDYWPDPVDCSGIYPYGKEAGEMKIFSRNTLSEFIALAKDASFELCAPPKYEARERAVRWERVDRDYTFFFAAFRKK